MQKHERDEEKERLTRTNLLVDGCSLAFFKKTNIHTVHTNISVNL